MSKSMPRNGQASNQLYMNLLYSDSESDTVPDLRLPPLKGKKPKKSQRRGADQESVCSLWTVLKVVTVIVLLACMVTLGLITYWALQQISELKDQINNLENKNAGTPEEFQALQSRLQAVNRTLVEKTSGLSTLNKSIAEIKNRISSLETRTNQLQQSLPAKDSNDVADKALADTVASLGSDLQSTKVEIDELRNQHKTVDSQISDLTNRVVALERPGGREGSADSLAVNLQTQLGQVNASLTQKIDKALTDTSKLQTEMEVMEDFTSDLQAQLQNVSSQVISVNQSHLALQASLTQNMKEGDKGNTGDSGTSVQNGDVRLANLETQVQQIQQQLLQIQTDHSSVNSSQPSAAPAPDTGLVSVRQDHEAFMTFRAAALQDIQALNGSMATLEGSVDALNTDVAALFKQITDNVQQVANVTSVVEGLVSYLQTHREQPDTVQKEPTEVPATQKDASTKVTNSNTSATSQKSTTAAPLSANKESENPKSTHSTD